MKPFSRHTAWRGGAVSGTFALAAMCAAPGANAGLIGDTVHGALVNFAPGGSISSPFAPVAVVGVGNEFVGEWRQTAPDERWQIAVDLDALSFTVSVSDLLNPAHILDEPTFVGLQLSELDPGGIISGVTFTGPTGVQSVGFSDHGVTVQWNVFDFRDVNGAQQSSGSWTFALQTKQVAAVPEPGAVALFALGLIGTYARNRRMSS